MILTLILLGVTAFILVLVYNSLVGKKNAVEQAFASIDVYLKKRYDLVPNLVAAVRAFDRVLQSGFYIVPFFHAPNQWFAHSADLKRPERLPRYASPLFGATLDTWWRQAQ
jgi:ABC-type oligopeptide transport system substrate-binding subunit